MARVNTSNILKIFLPIALTATILSLMIYWAIQQDLRLSANDPQIQMSEDAASYLKQGGVINFSPGAKIEMSQSLAPFLMIYDKDKKLISFSGVLHSKAANLPRGVLDAANKKGETRITWQPEDGVRSAIVVNHYKGLKEGYILVGRSLKEVERREELLSQGILAGWLLTLILSFTAIWVLNMKSKNS